jgi:CheY-like chemotaxis protein
VLRDTARTTARRLFRPFERLGTAEQGIEGTGSGLALSPVWSAMDGAIGVDSTLGQGSTFWFELLAADSPSAAALEQDSGEGPPVAPSGPSGTLLYIEDNPSNVRSWNVCSSDAPAFDSSPCRMPASGIEHALRDQPRLIPLDLHLPDLPGGKVLARLQSDPRTESIPVAVLSADASPGQVRQILAAGPSTTSPSPSTCASCWRSWTAPSAPRGASALTTKVRAARRCDGGVGADGRLLARFGACPRLGATPRNRAWAWR